MPRRVLLTVVLAAALSMIAAIAVLALARDDAPTDVGGTGFAGAVRPANIPPSEPEGLRDQDGKTVRLADFAGTPIVVTFLYTTCEDTCPLTAQQIRGALDDLGEDVPVLAFSVDPANDTPEVLRAYAERFGADRSRWLFLTGEQEAIRQLAIGGLKLPLADGDPAQGEDAILHSQRFVLIDAQGQVRGTYDVRDQEGMLRLRGDLEHLAASDRG